MSLYIAPIKSHSTQKKRLSNSNKPQKDNDVSSEIDITRYAHLYVKLLQIFPKSRSSLLVPHPCFSSNSNIHILVDFSNIYIGFCKTLESYFDYYFKEKSEDGDDEGPLATYIRDCLSKHSYAKHAHTLDVSALSLILQRGRSVSTKYLCGSTPSNKGKTSRQYKIYESMFDKAKNENFEVDIKDRVFHYQISMGITKNESTKDDNNNNRIKEMGVDELLALKIHHIVAKDRSTTATSIDKGINQYGNCPTSGKTNTTTQGSNNNNNLESVTTTNYYMNDGKEHSKMQKKTIILATGDGNPSAHQSLDFLTSIESALQSGYNVELFSFGESLNSRYKRLAMLYGDNLRIVYLDEFVWELASNALPSVLKQYLDERGLL